MNFNGWRASKSGRFSAETIGCLWNVFQCVIIFLWRGYNHKAEHADDNFFRLGVCSSLFLTNILICFLLTTFHGQREEHHVTLKYWLIAPTVIHILSVLFGAPLFKYWDQTISFSLMGSALILPSVVCSGKLGNLSNFSGSLEWIGPIELWTCLGAWLGAFVIPLDWDRPWQVWPEPCCVGAVLGCGLSSLLRLMRPLVFSTTAGNQMYYWPSQFFVHERLVL